MQKITESPSPYRHLERMPVRELLENMNGEDQQVPLVVAGALPQIEALIERALSQMRDGGRLFYIGAGTSGRLGILDASECPPTFGVPEDWVIGIIAGGDTAIRRAVEFAEDDLEEGWQDLKNWYVTPQDFVVGITAAGTTPYVVHALRKCRDEGIPTGCITCNPDSPVAAAADYPVEVITGPEFVTGSTRLKAGTAQKLVLNLISTSLMIRLGRVKDNRMVDMQLSNQKLIDRGTRILMHTLGLDYDAAKKSLLQYGSVRKAMDAAGE